VIKLSIVGTNWISKSFLDSALKIGEYEFFALYSRTEQTATTFCEGKFSPLIATDFDAFVNLSDLEMVYIASPNSLHFQQAKKLVKKGISIIVEKPAFSNVKEFNEIVALSKKYDALIFEAARHVYEENFRILKENLRNIGEVIGGRLAYMKYSSRYDQVLAGEKPNIFSLDYSGGALMDLGIYLIYAALELFGKPSSHKYFCQKITTGVDGIGTILFRYDTFDLTMQTGKIADASSLVEIYGSKGTLHANSMEDIDNIWINGHGGAKKELILAKPATNMTPQAEVFARLYSNRQEEGAQKEYNRLLDLAKEVHSIITDLRYQAEIIFPADQE